MVFDFCFKAAMMLSELGNSAKNHIFSPRGFFELSD